MVTNGALIWTAGSHPSQENSDGLRLRLRTFLAVLWKKISTALTNHSHLVTKKESLITST